MRWCSQCVLPDTRPNLVIGEDGVCNACKSHGTKREIEWAARERQFRDVADRARTTNSGHDCVIPVSGGKDSTWQVVKCLEYGLTPLCVTWRPPGRTAIGQRNLDNLIRLGVDHIDYAISPKTEAAFTLRAFEKFGSTAVPMHTAIFSIPLTIAHRFGIPLVIWGENSAFEYGSADEAHTGFKLDAEWLKHYGVTHGTTAEDWLDEGFTRKQLASYFGPSAADMGEDEIRAVFLGYYFEWDAEETRKVAAEHGFEADTGGARTGYWDFADIDDDFISIHHWMKWYKFGFTRLFDNLSIDIRNGRISRDDAIAIIQKIGEDRPDSDIDKLATFLGIDRSRFLEIAETFRNTEVWQRRPDGAWAMPNFLIEDWTWT